MTRKIEFIYFDVGGVAILDFSKTNKWDEMLKDLEVTDALRPQFDELFNTHKKNIAIGEDPAIFVEEARNKLGVNFPLNYDMTADYVNRFEKNPSMLKLIEKLRKDFRLGLLTVQYLNMLNLIFEKKLLPRDIWEIILDTSVVGITKPDPEIYHMAQTKANVPPEKILFIDNKAKLLEYPKSLCWQVFEYDPANAVVSTKKLEEYINSNNFKISKCKLKV